jgi:hypothetical protein
MARRRKQHRKKHLSGLGAITDSKFFIPGIILAGAAIYLMTRKKKPTIELPDMTVVAEGEKITGEAQRATMAAGESAPATQEAGKAVSMGSDKPKTVTDLVNQVRASEIASGPAGTEVQGGGSVSADPKEQLKLMSTPDFLEKMLKSPEFKAAVVAGTPVLGDLGAEIDRRFGAEGRALIASKMPSSQSLLGEVVTPLRKVYARGQEADAAKLIAAYLADPKNQNDDAFVIVAYYNVVAIELADRAAGRKPEPVGVQEVLPAAPVAPAAPPAMSRKQKPPAKAPAPTYRIQPSSPAGQMAPAPAAPKPPAAAKPAVGNRMYAGGAAPGSKYYGKAF